MLPSVRNKLTESILQKMRAKGAPSPAGADSQDQQDPATSQGMMGEFDADTDDASGGQASSGGGATIAQAPVSSSLSQSMAAQRRKKKPGSVNESEI